MKRAIASLQIGDIVEGLINEVLSEGDLIVSLSGDLIRAYNQSEQRFKAGDIVLLVVRAVAPLKFQLASSELKKTRRELDLFR